MTESLIDAKGFYDMVTNGHNVTLHDAMGELIDNSWDANATKVKIDFRAEGFICNDNGHGEDDVGKLNTYCKSSKKKNNETIGKWGMGWHAACAIIARGGGSDDEEEGVAAEPPPVALKLYGFISKGKTTLCKVCEFKPFDKDQSETLNKNLEKVFKDADEAKEAMEDTVGAYTVIPTPRPYNKIQIDSIKNFLAHAYYTQLESGNTIELNGESIEGKKFSYGKEDEDWCVDFDILPTSKKNEFDLHSNNSSMHNNVTLNIINNLTENMVKTSCYKKNTFKTVKREKTYTNSTLR